MPTQDAEINTEGAQRDLLLCVSVINWLASDCGVPNAQPNAKSWLGLTGCTGEIKRVKALVGWLTCLFFLNVPSQLLCDYDWSLFSNDKLLTTPSCYPSYKRSVQAHCANPGYK